MASHHQSIGVYSLTWIHDPHDKKLKSALLITHSIHCINLFSVYYKKQTEIPYNTCVWQNTELQGVLFKNISLWRTSLDLKLIDSDVNPRTRMMHLKWQIYSVWPRAPTSSDTKPSVWTQYLIYSGSLVSEADLKISACRFSPVLALPRFLSHNCSMCELDPLH